MKTIEERAYKSAPIDLRHGAKYWIYAKGYEIGATEQREIDIKKACNHLEQLGVFDLLADGFGVSTEVLKERFIFMLMEE